jgi:hypothetical protein
MDLQGQGPNWLVALIEGTTAVPQGVAKLLETIADQIGFSLEPFHIRRKAKAQADAAITAAKGQGEIAQIQLEKSIELKEIEIRAKERVSKREARRQRNLEAIAVKAAREVPESVSEKPVDEDWLAQFFENCQDVSNEGMQTVWARLLAGEIAQPGTYSYRALSAVKMLRPDHAHLFTEFCTFLWHHQNELVPILDRPALDLAEKKGLTFTNLLLLRQLNLIDHGGIAGFSLKPDNRVGEAIFQISLNYYGRWHVLRLPPHLKEFVIGQALLTDIGSELAPIAGASASEEYRRSMVDYWRSQNIEVEEIAT